MNDVTNEQTTITQLKNLGDEWAKLSTTKRHDLVHQYFDRVFHIASGMVTLAEYDNSIAVFALQKSLYEAVLYGLYYGYIIDDADLENHLHKAAMRETTKISWEDAKRIDARAKATYLTNISQTRKRFSNEWQHGGLIALQLNLSKNQLVFSLGDGIVFVLRCPFRGN